MRGPDELAAEREANIMKSSDLADILNRALRYIPHEGSDEMDLIEDIQAALGDLAKKLDGGVGGCTPGPWSWNRMPHRFLLLSAKGEETGLAVRILVAEDEVWPNQPNARLIAAAPEMAEALGRALDVLDDLPFPEGEGAKQAARAALAKAGIL